MDDFRFSPRSNRAAEIRWQAWSEEAFAKASAEDKPILLSISAVWCHWCHEMDEASYSDQEVIDLVNERFVPIRVDSDRNPDINSRYNQGGWPSTVFLSPDAAVLAGTTYVPPAGMRSILVRVSNLWKEHKVTINVPEEDLLLTKVIEEGPEPDIVTDIGYAILRAWDRDYGGLGDAPKFPQAESIALALELYMDGYGEDFLSFARSTLEGMLRGGLMDEGEGGFFRYSTTRDWTLPHYEKMLSDNVALLSVLLRAYKTMGFPLLREAAIKTAEYIKKTLSDGQSRFYGSQDADEAYYNALPEERLRMKSPAVDKTVYTDWAAQAAIVFIQTGALLDNREYTDIGMRALDFLWSESFREAGGMAHYNIGLPKRFGLLDDQVSTALAFMQAYGLTGNKDYFEHAQELMRIIREDYWDETNGELLDTAAPSTLPGLKPDSAEPTSQARGAEAMLHFWVLTGDETWHEMAKRILTGWKTESQSYGILAAPLARAINFFVKGPLLIRLLSPSPKEAGDFLEVALLSPLPRLLPELKLDETGQARAEICDMQSCTLSTSDTKAMAEELNVRHELFEGVKRS
ncbi:MAG: hypothetical protein A2W01_03585 [Candidatus Solincola sediminis]|uniref:Spermatogenesis-associated protein 20-like TRX domain-containing protein n=1 Tax=Candidatus Solincola sediminis TaxID=1797199 RepID=A0A1F2WQU9_9ACTN|nr:MAG: hypothetical protein A2W01_03585 [Candidatus Solincola sediminis]OFW59234.1 MAG: hypothetical protein A2Y75_01800 [Candidatus Solincola sediminis]